MNHPRLALLLIFSLVPLGPLAIDIYLPSMPQMIEVFEVSEQQMQLTLSIYVFALGLSQLIAGPVSDRRGRRASALTGLAFYAAGSLLAALAPTLTAIYLARILQGIGAAFTMVTAMAWVRDHYEGETAGKWLSYMGGMTSVIPTMAPMLGGVLALAWGWAAGFFAVAIYAVLLILLTAFALAREKPASTTIEREHLSCRLRDILGHAQFRAYSLANLFSFGGLLTYIAVAPVVAMRQGGLSELDFATLFGLIGLCQMACSLIAPRLVAMIGQRPTVATGLAIAALGGLGLWLLPAGATYGFFALAALGCGGFSLLVGTATALNLQPFPGCAGLATAIDGFLRMIGGATIAALIGMIGLTGNQALALALLLTLLPLCLVLADIHQHQTGTVTD